MKNSIQTQNHLLIQLFAVALQIYTNQSKWCNVLGRRRQRQRGIFKQIEIPNKSLMS